MNMCQKRYVCLTEHGALRVGLTKETHDSGTPELPVPAGLVVCDVLRGNQVEHNRDELCLLDALFSGRPGVGRDPYPEDLAHLEAAALRMEALVQLIDPVGEEGGDVATEDARKVGLQQKTQGTLKCLA